MESINDVVVNRLCYYLDEKKITQYRLSILSGILLDYIYEHKTEEFFSQCWNSRID